MKNTLENAIKFRYSDDFEFLGLDEESNEILYIRCDNDYKAIYDTALAFARRFIDIGCGWLVVKDLFFNDIVLHIHKKEMIVNNEYNEYAIACQIIKSIVEEY